MSVRRQISLWMLLASMAGVCVSLCVMRPLATWPITSPVEAFALLIGVLLLGSSIGAPVGRLITGTARGAIEGCIWGVSILFVAGTGFATIMLVR